MAKKIVKESQPRTKETRRLLLAAAQEVFVRDGYEKAQVAAIASAANRTKGAVYAHFKNKEDLFLALFEERMAEFTQHVRDEIAGKGKAESLNRLRDFFAERARDKDWALLVLEFKLFVLRHSESKRKLRLAHQATGVPGFEESMLSQFGARATAKKLGMTGSLAALGPILSSFALESRFDPVLFSEERRTLMIKLIFDALISNE